MDAIKGIGGEGDNAILNQKEDQNKDLEAIFDAVKQTPQADTDSIVSTLGERLPEVVQDLVTQQVELEKKRLAQENEKRLNEINAMSTDVFGVIERRDYLLKLERERKSRCRVIPPNSILRMVQRKEREHRQELLHAAQRFVGIKGWSGS